MKKSLAVLCMIACMLGLCACGSQTNVKNTDVLVSNEEAIQVGQETVEGIVMIVEQGLQDQYKGQDVILAGLDSWEKALADVGTYTGIISSSAEVSEDEAIVTMKLGGSSHDAVMEIILDEEGYKSISTTVEYSFGEMMSKAGLNTLVGMGTVFVVLVLISLIISCFQLIPKIQDMLSGKNKKDNAKDIKAEAVDNTIAQIIEKEEASDDLELIAVIAAAIAASEGAAGTDGFVVRSIRKRA